MASLPLNDATHPRDGSLAGMTAMWREGITCFDVDGVLTSDGVMLATHPKRFADATGGARPAEMTLARARDAGADEAGFPTLDDVIAHFASLVEATAPDARPYWWRGDDSFARRSVSPRRRGRRPAAPPLTGPVLCPRRRTPRASSGSRKTRASAAGSSCTCTTAARTTRC